MSSLGASLKSALPGQKLQIPFSKSALPKQLFINNEVRRDLHESRHG